ncbi:MAG: YmdB family metallophosphoesterase, partial [Erysipelotrichaceae bacterium]|nr:YmdB family metallophosphoesterase [Erysipelotrichaceae bacterium]
PETDRLICPVNHISGLGEGYRVFNVKDTKICVVNILGTLMQEEYTTDPYEAMDKVLKKTKKEGIDLYIVDFHAEATAEKRVFIEYYRDRVNAVIGTHTHIQTADEQIIDGAAFITDVGMCGPFESIIGRDIEECIDRMVRKQETRYTVSLSEPILCGLYMEFEDEGNRCINIERIQIRP